MTHFGGNVDDPIDRYEDSDRRVDALLSPEVIRKARDAWEALKSERGRLVDIGAQTEDHDADFRESIQTQIELIETALDSLNNALPLVVKAGNADAPDKEM